MPKAEGRVATGESPTTSEAASSADAFGAARVSTDATALDRKIVDALERLGQGLRALLWDTATTYALSPLQAQLLLRIAAEPPSAREVGALARLLDVTQPTASDALAALRRKGLVVRTPCEHDRRRATLAPTPEGRTLAADLLRWDDRLVSVLADRPWHDRERLLGVLLDLIAALQREGVVTVARMCVTCRFFRPDRHPGVTARHHCALLDLPLAAADLRVDCPDHQPLATARA